MNKKNLFLLSVAAFSLGVSAQTGKEWDDARLIAKRLIPLQYLLPTQRR